MPINKVPMDIALAKFGFDSNPFNVLLSFLMLMVFFMFYPRLMLTQIMWKLERVVKDLEEMSDDSKNTIAKEIKAEPDKNVRDAINRFFEFFMMLLFHFKFFLQKQ